MLQFPLFVFQAVNDLVTELERANITCTATITFAENDYKEQLKTLKVKTRFDLNLLNFFLLRRSVRDLPHRIDPVVLRFYVYDFIPFAFANPFEI